MELGKFSVSLAVNDLAASRAFYEALGFKKVDGDEAKHFLIMGNASATIGLFQGMFEENILTFNPGWSDEGTPLEDFEDVRSIQARLKAAGIQLMLEADPESTGVAHIFMTDPDGNQIMLDQHVDKPGG
ncbi:MAG: VOC family protein [Planctomycetota bacterium]